MKFVVFIALPVLEIVVAALVAHFVGWPVTILALVASMVIGILQLRVQGIAAFAAAQREVAEGHFPAPAVFDGMLRLIGAVLLVVPGFLSALAGLVLLIRPARSFVARGAGVFLVTRFRLPFQVVPDGGRVSGWRFGSDGAPDVVDVDGWEESPRSPSAHPPAMITPRRRSEH